MRFLVTVLVVLAACKGGQKTDEHNAKTLDQQLEADRAAARANREEMEAAAARGAAIAKAKAAAADPLTAAPTGAKSADELWDAYVAAHRGATPANAIETGKKIWPLIGKEARQIVTDAVEQQLARLTVKVPLTHEELAYKLVGESAAARAAAMAENKVLAGTPHNPIQLPDGTIQERYSWDLGDHGRTLRYEGQSEGGVWTLAPSKDLMVSDAEVFKTPAGKQGPTGAATVQAAVERWKQVMESGTGWDAYNVMSPTMRKRLEELVAQMGGSGPDDVARIFEKTIVDRRDRGIHVKSTALSDQTDTSANVAFTYTDGKTDNFSAVRVDGLWWIEMPI